MMLLLPFKGNGGFTFQGRRFDGCCFFETGRRTIFSEYGLVTKAGALVGGFDAFAPHWPYLASDFTMVEMVGELRRISERNGALQKSAWTMPQR
jgi:hypothetical protein